MDSKLRFVEFIQDSGEKITINTAHVVAIGEIGNTADTDTVCCAVFLSSPSRSMSIVRGSYAEVKERCLY